MHVTIAHLLSFFIAGGGHVENDHDHDHYKNDFNHAKNPSCFNF